MTAAASTEILGVKACWAKISPCGHAFVGFFLPIDVEATAPFRFRCPVCEGAGREVTMACGEDVGVRVAAAPALAVPAAE